MKDNQGYCVFGDVGSLWWQVFGYIGCITVNGRFELLLSVSLISPLSTSLGRRLGYVVWIVKYHNEFKCICIVAIPCDEPVLQQLVVAFALSTVFPFG